mmetsp:Transcript_17388/g.40790  ORF Transcript_17388/g.40790 Transcript_17388/m.40790 type:complete len:211 (+) Transcript_17388:122-754(+)
MIFASKAWWWRASPTSVICASSRHADFCNICCRLDRAFRRPCLKIPTALVADARLNHVRSAAFLFLRYTTVGHVCQRRAIQLSLLALPTPNHLFGDARRFDLQFHPFSILGNRILCTRRSIAQGVLTCCRDREHRMSSANIFLGCDRCTVRRCRVYKNSFVPCRSTGEGHHGRHVHCNQAWRDACDFILACCSRFLNLQLHNTLGRRLLH